jgi:hypothetical protein
MSDTMNTDSQERIRIQAYSLFDFMKALEERIIQGYRVSDKSGDFPVAMVSYYTCQLVKVAEPMLGDVPILYTEDKRASFVEPQDDEQSSQTTQSTKTVKAKGVKAK